MDPKYLAALKRDIFPVDINNAPYIRLLRVPGIGPISARRIIHERRRDPIRKLEDLKRLGVIVSRAEPFIYLEGWQKTLDHFKS